MKNFTAIISGLLVIAGVVIIMVVRRDNALVHPQEVPVVRMAPVVKFSWRYQEGAGDASGLPSTFILLDVTYENGKILSQSIEEVSGSCNAIDPKSEDADLVAGTEKIQCYAAGFGGWYKIIRGDDSYEVRRKYFEEAHPDAVPPDYQYETIAEIPLTQ